MIGIPDLKEMFLSLAMSRPLSWPQIQDQVQADLTALNGALEKIGSVASFTMIRKEAGLEIYINNLEYNPKLFNHDSYRASCPEITAEVDARTGAPGLNLKYTSGPRPAGMTRPNLTQAQIISGIRENLGASLNSQDLQVLKLDRSPDLRAFRFC